MALRVGLIGLVLEAAGLGWVYLGVLSGVLGWSWLGLVVEGISLGCFPARGGI